MIGSGTIPAKIFFCKLKNFHFQGDLPNSGKRSWYISWTNLCTIAISLSILLHSSFALKYIVRHSSDSSPVRRSLTLQQVDIPDFVRQDRTKVLDFDPIPLLSIPLPLQSLSNPTVQ